MSLEKLKKEIRIAETISRVKNMPDVDPYVDLTEKENEERCKKKLG